MLWRPAAEAQPLDGLAEERVPNLRLAHPILLLTPLVILWLRFDTTGWPATGPSWVALLVAVLALVDIVLLGVMERQFPREPTASRLRAKGQTPEYMSALVGMVMMLAPVCWALLGSVLGLPATQLVWYAGLSLVGVAFWGWRYRRVIYAV